MNWQDLYKEESQKPYWKDLQLFLRDEYANKSIFPSIDNVFNAFKEVSFVDTRVVVLGQDPYSTPGMACGKAFAISGLKAPPSLRNILKELKSDLGVDASFQLNWKGVLLLNTILTVQSGRPLSHKGKGWEALTDRIIQELSNRKTPLVFVLWGREAQSKKELISKSHHLILEAAHPSPLSAYNGFFGCKHFSKVNDFLVRNKLEPINWGEK